MLAGEMRKHCFNEFIDKNGLGLLCYNQRKSQCEVRALLDHVNALSQCSICYLIPLLIALIYCIFYCNCTVHDVLYDANKLHIQYIKLKQSTVPIVALQRLL